MPLQELVKFVGRFHVLAVHLPLGVLVLVALAEALSLRPGKGERQRQIDAALGMAVPFLVATMLLSAVLGLLLAQGGGYPAQLAVQHRNLELAATAVSMVTLALWRRRARATGSSRTPYRVALLATVVAASLGGHLGGELTHGDGYLTRFAPAFLRPAKAATVTPVATAVVAPAEPLVFHDAVLPVLVTYCGECHSEKLVKGGLRVDSFAALMKGGEDGPSVVVGNGAESDLVHRMLLPPNDNDHMPPDGKAGPSAREIELVKWWIDRGATETLRLRDGLAPDGARAALQDRLTGPK